MKVDNENAPDFLIVGAAKSGTTSLYFYLKQHPRIYMSKIKEPWFFSYWDNPPKFRNDYIVTQKEAFHSLFEKAQDGQVMGEASVCYLYLAEETIRNIKKFYGENARKVKILIILRNPMDRAWSHYIMDTRDGLSQGAFEKCMDQEYIRKLIDSGGKITFDYVGFGMYFQQVRRYLEAFDNVKIILFDDLQHNPNGVMQDILAFLGVPAMPINMKTKYNVSGEKKEGVYGWMAKFLFQTSFLKQMISRFIPLNLKFVVRTKMGEKLFSKVELGESLRNSLYGVYKEDIDQLEQLIDRDLTFWKLSSAPAKASNNK